jgi:flagellar biosynthesis GTPase FlhF
MDQPGEKKKISLPAEKPQIINVSRTAEGPQVDGGETLGIGSVEKIRDILFGSQMRDYEKKFAELKERMQEEVAHLREESRKRFEMIEGYIKDEVESMSERLRKEHDERSEAFKEILQEQKDTTRALEKKISQLDDQLSKHTRDLRQQILDKSQSLSEDIRKKRDEAAAALDRVALGLRTSKVNRALLSEIFVNMAMRLTDEGPLISADKTGAPLNE